ncbi:unannotated protein [freshwater metagenome]|uniref:Unannotated protein n=1 Tax=freshwater metagenome TaxID=449393 RepID=A0A6J7III4_9ZZZZ
MGTSLVTGSGSPTAGMVYKLVERDGVPVAKTAEGKRSVGGRKSAVRRHDGAGTATAEVVVPGAISPQDGDRDLVVPLVQAGVRVTDADPAAWLRAARGHHEQVRTALPAEAWSLSRGEPAIDTVDR